MLNVVPYTTTKSSYLFIEQFLWSKSHFAAFFADMVFGFMWQLFFNGTLIPFGEGVSQLMMSYSAPTALSLALTGTVPTTTAEAITVTLTGNDLFDDCTVIQVWLRSVLSSLHSFPSY